VPKRSAQSLDQLLYIARKASNAADIARAEDAFFNALLDATIYAHVPIDPPPEGSMRFVQFIRPDNGQTVLPFFSDRNQAEAAAAGSVGIVAMQGLRFFDLTRGATVMLNPNRDRIALYPAEINALLGGRPVGTFTQEIIEADEQVRVSPPTMSTAILIEGWQDLYVNEPAVRSAYLAEVHRTKHGPEAFLLLTLVVTAGNDERIVHLTALKLGALSPDLSLPVTVSCVRPDEPLPEICHAGIQFYGT